MATLTEAYLFEEPAIKWFQDMGYSYIHGSELSPEEERDSYRDVILKKRFITAVKNLIHGLLTFKLLKFTRMLPSLSIPILLLKENFSTRCSQMV